MLPNAIYLRKSRSDPDDETIEETLERHRKTLLEFSKKTKLVISDIFYEVVSGDGLFVRPEMIKLLNNVEAGKYSGVLCVDIDRLGRVDTKDRGIILDTFKENNTKIITPTKTYDLTDEIDEFSTEMQMLFARQELKKITKRLRAGMLRTTEDGYHVSDPPFGYRRAYVDKRPTLEICEPEANIIRMVFDMYVNQHFGSSTIATHLNNMGIKPRKSEQFGRTTIQYYLSNPLYAGQIIYNKKHRVKRKLPTDKNKYITNPKEDWIVTEGVHPAIVDKAIFDEAQRIRKEHTHPPSYTGEIMNPLAGIIRCANCGKIMTRQTSKRTPPRLLCNTVGCNKSTVIYKVEDVVLDNIRNTLEEYKLKPVTADTRTAKHIESLQSSITELKKQITILKKQNENLHDLLEQGVYDIKTFVDRSRILTDKITDAETLLSEKELLLKQLDTAPNRSKIIPLMQQLLENYDEMSAAEKNSLYKKIIENIYYKREKVNKSEFDLEINYRQWF